MSTKIIKLTVSERIYFEVKASLAMLAFDDANIEYLDMEALGVYPGSPFSPSARPVFRVKVKNNSEALSYFLNNLLDMYPRENIDFYIVKEV